MSDVFGKTAAEGMAGPDNANTCSPVGQLSVMVAVYLTQYEFRVNIREDVLII